MQFSFSKRFLLVLFSFLMIFAACDDCTFPSDHVQAVRLQFVQNDTVRARSFRAVYSPESLQDSLYKGDSVTTFVLPLLTTETQVVYIFEPTDSTQTPDTLLLGYQTRVIPVPPDCGVDQQINDLQVVLSTFPATEVLHTTLLNENEVDVKVTF